MMRVWHWLRSKFSEAALTVPALDPRQTPMPTAPTAIEQPARKKSQAKSALPWTDEIATHNQQVWRDRETYRAYLRTAYDVGDEPLPAHFAVLEAMAADDLERMPQDLTPRRLAIEYLVDQRIRQEERTANVTGLQPKFQPVSVEEAREVARLEHGVAALEAEKATWTRPTPAEVLAAAGGDERKSAQIQAKVDAIFGVDQRQREIDRLNNAAAATLEPVLCAPGAHRMAKIEEP